MLLEGLRARRNRPERGRGVAEDMASLLKGIKRVSAQASRAGEAWGVAAPDGVAASTRVTDLKGGVLHVAVRTAADRHRADRWLRSGGLAELRALAKAPISRVRFQLDASV